MANTIRIKRRAAGGAAGAPASLANAELAFNEQDDILYYGKGTGGAGGTATTVMAIGGPGAFQAADADLTALAGVSTAGLLARTGNGAAAARTLTGPAAGLSITNGDGVAGNPTIALANDLAALEGLGTMGLIARTADGAASTRTLTGPAAGLTVSNGDGVSGNPTIALANDLAALEGLTTTGLVARTADGVATTRAVTGTAGRIGVTNGDGVSGAPTVDLAALTIGGSGVGTFTKVTVDTYGRVTGTAQASRSDLAAPTADVSNGGFKLTNLADPVSAQDAATKAYVDAARSGLDVKASVRAASTANVTLTYTATGGASARGQITAAPNTLDGVTLAANDRILLKDQSTGAQNGIYVVTTLGTGANGVWDRATDFDADAEVTAGAFTFVAEGTANADSGWVLSTNDAITIGGASGTALAFAQFSGAGQVAAGAGLTKTGNTLDIGTASASRIVVNADNLDLATTGVSASTYKSVTVDVYGRVTGGTNPTTLAGYGISDAQPLDATLTALAGVTTAADRLIYATGADAFAVTTLTAFGRSLLDDADAATAQATLGLGSIATQAASNVSITGGAISNLTTFDGNTIDGGSF